MDTKIGQPAKRKRGPRTEGYRSSRKRMKSLQTISSDDPLLLRPDCLENLKYIESVLKVIGRPGDVELHDDALCQVSSTLFPLGFVQKLKFTAASETAKRRPLGLPKISGTLLFCELVKVGLSVLDPMRIQGILPSAPPALIERSKLAALVKDFTLDTKEPLANITVAFPSILLVHVSHGFQYRTSDPLSSERTQASKLRRLVAMALDHLLSTYR